MNENDTTPTEQSAIGEAEEHVQDLPRKGKISKLEEKRLNIYRDRMKRHIANGMSPEDAHLAIQREDYEKLPIEKKLQRVESIVAQNLQGLRNDILTLKQNQENLADAMDANFRAFAKMMTRLGLSEEQQRAIFDEEVEGMEAEAVAKNAAAALAQEQAQEKALQEAVAAPAPDDAPTQVPDEATVFGS